MDRGAWQATVHWVAQSDVTERPSTQWGEGRGKEKNRGKG